MTKDKFDRQAFDVNKAVERSTNRLTAALKPEFQTGDHSNMPTDQWHELIRQNWQDQEWRASKAKQYGAVNFVKDAMDAFGIPRSALQSVPGAPPAGSPTPTQPDIGGDIG